MQQAATETLLQPQLMFIILFSPFLALFCDRVIRNYQIRGRWTIPLIVLLVVPISALWLSDYSFTNKNLSAVGNYASSLKILFT